MYITGLSIITALALLCLLSKSVRNQLKFLVVPLLTLSVASLAYYAITGKPPTQIPGDINSYFSKSQLQDEPSHKYYQDPDKRYGDQVK